MSVSPSLPLVESPSQPRMGSSVIVTGLGGERAAAVLRQAGYTVIVASDLEYARLELVDLLVLAPAPPEPAAVDLVRHLRQRSSVRTLALVDGLRDAEREQLRAAASDACLDAHGATEALLAAVHGLIGSQRTPPGEAAPGAPAVSCLEVSGLSDRVPDGPRPRERSLDPRLRDLGLCC